MDLKRYFRGPFVAVLVMLLLFFILQRKAICCSVEMPITEVDEPRVRWFLEECARTTRAIWEPIGLSAPTAGGAA